MVTKIKAEIQEKWAAALESGAYQQATGALRKNDAFCCLGVLCDLYQRETGRGRWDESLFVASGEKTTLTLPSSVQRWAGVEDENPTIADRGNAICFAAYLNDNGTSFTEIAQLIRELPSIE